MCLPRPTGSGSSRCGWVLGDVEPEKTEYLLPLSCAEWILPASPPHALPAPPPPHTHSSWALVIGQPSFGVALFSFFTVSAVTRQPVLPVSRDHTLFCLEEESALIQIEDLFNPENL